MDDPSAADRTRWTGVAVRISENEPTLKRFAGKVGRVVTVNMNGRALVQFSAGVDEGWYDLPVSCLKDVSNVAGSEAESASPTFPPHSETSPLPRLASPLPTTDNRNEQQRQESLAAADVPAKPLSPAAETPATVADSRGSRPSRQSVLEMARRQGAPK